MYVWKPSACHRTCRMCDQTYTLKITCFKKWKICWACMYVWIPSACHGKWNIQAQTYTLNHHKQNQKCRFAKACMFETHLLVVKTIPKSLKHTRLTAICFRYAKRVCFKTHLPVKENAFGPQRKPIKNMILGGHWKLIDIHTILILVYIHTYWEFARRINIDFNPCATHRIEIPKRTRLGEDFPKTIKIFSEIQLSRVNSRARPQVKIFFQLLFR